jgi:hypothetical protein
LVRAASLPNSLVALNAAIRENSVPLAGFLRASCAAA